MKRLPQLLLPFLAILPHIGSSNTFYAIKPFEELPLHLDQSAVVDINAYFGYYSPDSPRVLIATSLGDIHLDLFPDKAPATVANFLHYVTSHSYDNSIFHRSVPDFVIQTGGFRILYDEQGPYFSNVETQAPVINEPGIPNTRGTVAMAKLGGDPNSATSQWFINLNDNRSNLDNQNGGFTVFAEVDEAGMSVADAIADLPYYNLAEYLGMPALTEIPLRDVQPDQPDLFLSNLIMISSATIVPIPEEELSPNQKLSLKVLSVSHPSKLKAEANGHLLKLSPTGTATGEVEVAVEIHHAGGTHKSSLRVNLQPAFVAGLLPSSLPVADGWWYSDWLGFFWAGQSSWVYHEQLDWIFLSSYKDDEAFWAWSPHPDLGWLWTSRETFPWCYQVATENYVYLDTSEGTSLRFYLPGKGWQQLP